MNYQQVIEWMFNQFPMYQNIGSSAYKPGLEKTLMLMDYLDNPHLKFKSIHVGGTNGKGSTCHIISSVLQTSGYKVGLFSSPHLKDFRERIKINGVYIPEDFVVDFVNIHFSFLSSNSFSFFEITVGICFDYFSKLNIDIAIIEVGLGGRLDSTNVINPLLSIITNISLDHTNILGDSISSIAFEKGGIIKQDTPVLLGSYTDVSLSVFSDISSKLNSSIIHTSTDLLEYTNCDLKGDYQHDNYSTAFAAIKYFISLGYDISEYDISYGFSNVSSVTNFKGRWTILNSSPLIICDTGHNKAALLAIFKQISHMNYDNLRIVFGLAKDKGIEDIVSILPNNAYYYLCSPKNNIRCYSSYNLHKIFSQKGLKNNHYNSIQLALESAENDSNENDFIFIGGSNFVVSEVL